jgi:hypothetical protein
VTDKDQEATPPWLASARIAYWVALPIAFVASVAVFGLGRSGMPKAVPLGDGRTAYYLLSWVGAMFWPLAIFLFLTFVLVGHALGMGKGEPPVSTLRGRLRPHRFPSLMGIALAMALALSEVTGQSPFRHFYCVVVAEDAVVLRSGLWSRRIPRSEVADVTYHVHAYRGRREYRYPTLTVRDASGNVWRSVEEQYSNGGSALRRYKTFVRDIRQQLALPAELERPDKATQPEAPATADTPRR